MKTIFHTLLVFLVCGCAADATEKTDRERDGLTGPVQVVRVEASKLSLESGKWIEGPRILSSVKVYDAEGNMTKEGRFSGGGKTVKTYDANGNLTEKARYDGSLKWKVIKTYDAKGNQTEERTYRSDGTLDLKRVFTYGSKEKVTACTTYHIVGSIERKMQEHLYTYDQEGNLAGEAEYYRSGSLRKKVMYAYDAKGKRTEEIVYDPDGSVTKRVVRAFDAKRNRIESVEYGASDSLLRTVLEVYDDRGNLSEKVFRDKEGVVTWREVYRWDENDRLLEQSWYGEGGTLDFRQVWTYDARDNLTEYAETKYGAGGSLGERSVYVNELDSHGNWIKRTELAWTAKSGGSHFEPREVTYRTIAYFQDLGGPDPQELQEELLRLASSVPKKKLQVEVRLYTDGDCRKESHFFDRSGATLLKSVHYTIRSTSAGIGMATAMSGGLYDPGGHLIQGLSGKSTDGNGWYRGSYDFQAADEAGIWVLQVTCDKSDYLEASDSGSLHLYSGSGVSSYRMDFDKTTSRNESVLENKHLIAVFGDGKISSKVLLYLYQKDTKTSYKFGKANIGRFDYMYNRFDGLGEVTSDQSVERVFCCDLAQEAEGMSKASLSVDINLKFPINELVTGSGLATGKVSIWENVSDGYKMTWDYQDDPDLAYPRDVEIGDTDNDGKNEVVFFTGKYVMVVEHQSAGYELVWKGSLDARNDRTLGVIGDTDNDEANEIVACNNKREFVIYEYNRSNGEYYDSAHIRLPDSCWGNGLGDFDKDGKNEIAVGQAGEVLIYKYSGTDYVQDEEISVNVGIVDDLSTGDIDGDGFPEILVCGSGKKFQVIDYDNGSYYDMYTSPTYANYVQSCVFGDLDNDGELEIMATIKKMMFFEYDNGDFTNTWNSTASPYTIRMHSMTVGDPDSDGLEELLIVQPGFTVNVHDYAIWGNKSGGPGLGELWSKASSSAEDSPCHMTAGDLDMDGYETNFTIEIKLRSEDADWLEYRVHNMKVDPNINSVFPILSGSLGAHSADDRYHLENGSDDLITTLKADVWNSFSADVSNYCMIYDNSTDGDTANNVVLAWVRFKESKNVKFQGVGLWNDTSGRASSRIRYNIKDATSKDSFSYLLVFSKGSPNIIDKWLPGIRAGRLSESSFMTRANGSTQDTVISKP